MSHAWSRFESELLNANSWAMRKDGLPSDLLDALSADERAKAATILKDRLDGRDDWPVRAMAHLRIFDSVPRLRELLQSVREPGMRAVIATSIFELMGDTTMEKVVTEVAEDRSLFWGIRIDAVHCLSRFKSKSSATTLATLRNDPEYLVAYNAKIAAGGRKQFWDPD